MELNPKHSILMELKKKAAADPADQTVKDLIWWLFDASMITSCSNLHAELVEISDACKSTIDCLRTRLAGNSEPMDQLVNQLCHELHLAETSRGL